MRLQMESIDETTPKGRMRRAIAQLKEAKVQARYLMVQEIDSMASRLQSHTEAMQLANNSGNIMWGSLGPQFDASKFNSLAGSIIAYDEAIELLEDLLR